MERLKHTVSHKTSQSYLYSVGRDGFHSVPNQTLRPTAFQEETVDQRSLLLFPLSASLFIARLKD